MEIDYYSAISLITCLENPIDRNLSFYETKINYELKIRMYDDKSILLIDNKEILL